MLESDPGGGLVRVLHLVEHLYQGGIERLLEQLALHTPSESQSLSFFTYHTPKLAGIGAQLAEHGVPVHTYDKGKGYDFKLLAELIRLVKEQKLDVIHTHDFGPTEYAVALKVRFPKLKLVHTHHTLHDFLQKRRYVWFFRFAALFYTRIIGVSDYVTDTLRFLCPLSRRKIVTVSNGLDLEKFDRPLSALTPKLRLVNVSRISPEKNLIHVLRTCLKLKRAKIPFELHHAGAGTPEQEAIVQAFVKEHSLENEVFFAGFQEDVRPILQKGDIFVSASKSEGHPVAVLEAMASGLLCVCSDIAPHRQVSKQGILFFSLDELSLYQQLRRIHLNPSAYRDVAAQAKRDVRERFSLEKMISGYGRVYA